MGVLSNKIKKDDLKPGDHIYTWRRLYIYAHHGIYVGNGNVIHFTRGGGQEMGTGTVLDSFMSSSIPSNPHGFRCPNCGDQPVTAGVISSCLECFLSGDDLYRFEYGVSTLFLLAKVRGGMCTHAPSDASNIVLHRAEYLLKFGFGAYNLFTNNCEDFALYCKTGLLVTGIRSGQVQSFQALAAASKVSSIAMGLRFMNPYVGGATLVVGGVKYFIDRLDTDIGRRTDVIKVPVEKLVDTLAVDSLDDTMAVERLMATLVLYEPGAARAKKTT